ncbi:enoyl-CoA hydratase domain-containing protein 3, mitochondrial [Neodiprion pinetum]|uniref:enoyl-CoA hydratase domain-containing protein 3, mitochondrial n=1 Tax=Neodiprion pinetum TaxID=441929 RepID=UPI001EE10175|nr:enoyl-CoA hydratase domain-containing protein 3, mitochondrial [Neodiprion pinetum]
MFRQFAEMLGQLRQQVEFGSRVGRSITRTFSTNNRLLGPERYVETTQSDDGVRTITLCHSQSRNSLSLHTMKILIDDVTKEQDSLSLRSIVIRATPGKVFSAGHNLKELTTNDGVQHHKEVFATAGNLMKALMQSPVPVIAAVDGLAAAAGCQLVAACDMAVCTENSSFSTPGANFGIFCSTPGVFLARNVPRKVAAHMLFTGIPISAQEALRAGLVSKVVTDASKLDEEITTITSAINAKSRSVVRLGKRFLYEQLEVDTLTASSMASEMMVGNLRLKDGQEGVQGFREKRKPVWTHDYETNH